MSTQQTSWAWAHKEELRGHRINVLRASYIGSFQGLAQIAPHHSIEYVCERFLDLVKAFEKQQAELHKEWEIEDAGRNPSA